ncbi:hypothetical protein PF005_g29186 [Phytophthora fragariae]|uniref:Uncharacterized protein n=2 Tax=Phytophthora TaxID=4783 RepID=A0A6A4AP70_9STRA|nr:hypothetical protein PF009_g33309 [Phytophthora fragariae]KAE8957936.1 hypothetical protein PR001_g31204 [Phytophthora rubi]KAE8952593.1 hypothetical protein PF011_g32659 [Phytophthora fragariae]KAE8957994.1 hypothetical protein PR002_g31008 [Phytophthora rubi]KAE9032185.1 hypothetical protein PF010_g33410 [Phytophthora fragariae]
MVKGGIAPDPVTNANDMIERVLQGLRDADDA